MTRMTPSEAFVETLIAQGVTEIFGIAGSAFMDAMDLFPTAGIRFIPTAHEQGADGEAGRRVREQGFQFIDVGSDLRQLQTAAAERLKIARG